MEGAFKSPFDEYMPYSMPPECRTAHFQMVMPTKWSTAHRPICIHLAGTGDQNYYRRRVFLANCLLKDGIGSIILTNPYYGVRKPAAQSGHSLQYVSDLFVTGGALILECLALIKWCTRAGFGPVVLHGISMGGFMASLAASAYDKPIPLVPCLSWTSGAPVFCDGVISHSVCWKVLTEQYARDSVYKDIRPLLEPFTFPSYVMNENDLYCSSPVTANSAASSQLDYMRSVIGRLTQMTYFGSGGGGVDVQLRPSAEPDLHELDQMQRDLELAVQLSEAQPAAPPSPLGDEVVDFMRQLLDCFTHLGNYALPEDPSNAHIVSAQHDAYVPRAGVLPLTKLWPGAQLRTVQGGHIGVYLRNAAGRSNDFRSAINDSIENHIAKYG